MPCGGNRRNFRRGNGFGGGEMDCIPMECRTACSRVKGRFPYHWDLNVYRGCTHDCKYCFARYSHAYLEEKDFAGRVFVKTNIVEMLEKQLRSPRWDKTVVNLGGVTDSYQPCEEREKKMPEILRLMIKYKNPVILSTKSDLVLRDFDLLDELSRLAFVNVASTVTVMDEGIRRKLEPGAVSSGRRMEMLRAFRGTKVHTSVHMMPVIPFLTDGEGNIEAVFSAAKQAGVEWVLTALLNLRGQTREVFLDFMEREYPAEYRKLLPLYLRGGLKEYRAPVWEKIARARRRYGLYADYQRAIDMDMEQRRRAEPVQLSLFKEE